MKGFTFIELLVSIFIMLLLLLLSFPFYLSINKQLTIDRAATRLVQDIRKVTEMTMSTKEFNNEYPDGGYWIHFPSADPDKYYLFADSDGDHKYDLGELIEEVEIEGKVEITDKTADFGNITFLAPEPIVFLTNFSGDDLVGVEAFVLLFDGSDSYRIYINKAGLVYIQ